MRLLPPCIQEAADSQIPEDERLLGEAAGGQDRDASGLTQSFGEHADADQVSSGLREKTVASSSCPYVPPGRSMWCRDTQQGDGVPS